MAGGIAIEGLAELRAAAAACETTLDRSIDEALLEASTAVATRAAALAPVRSGQMKRSIRPFVEEAVAGVEVTARRRSAAYPGGFPYPSRIERVRPFLRPAFQQEAAQIAQTMDAVLDDVATAWRGA